ncbi:MAG: GNAT family N-acetyltransferase [Anaerolineales bacterium]
MEITFRQYNYNEDYQRVDDFLIRHYQLGNRDGNWLEPAWEYMHYHPLLDSDSLDKIGIWEVNGEIVAVVHYEWRLGEAFFQFHPHFRHLCEEMLAYAEVNLVGSSKEEGLKVLRAYIPENDRGFQSLAQTRGYRRHPEADRPLARFDMPDPFPAIQLPVGYHLTSLEENPDWDKVHRVLWRGFNHEGDPPVIQEELESRRKMFDTPKARRDLKIAVEAPDGSFVSFCGMFYEPNNRYAYVEPVATDPVYRHLGLGRAAVLEGIRRTADLGAIMAFVGSNLNFYLSLGFKEIYTSQCWQKYIEE